MVPKRLVNAANTTLSRGASVIFCQTALIKGGDRGQRFWIAFGFGGAGGAEECGLRFCSEFSHSEPHFLRLEANTELSVRIRVWHQTLTPPL